MKIHFSSLNSAKIRISSKVCVYVFNLPMSSMAANLYPTWLFNPVNSPNLSKNQLNMLWDFISSPWLQGAASSTISLRGKYVGIVMSEWKEFHKNYYYWFFVHDWLHLLNYTERPSNGHINCSKQ